MAKRPSRHIRNVKTKKGREPRLINPNITRKEYKKLVRQLAPFADADKDGVVNINDCRPFNKKKQHDRLTARDPHSGKRVTLYYGSIEEARRRNPGLEDFDYGN